MFRLIRRKVVEISDLHHFLSHWSKKAKQLENKFSFVMLWNNLKYGKCPIFLDLSHYCFYFDKSVVILSGILQKTTLKPFCDSDSVTRILSDPSERLTCLALTRLLVAFYGITSTLASRMKLPPTRCHLLTNHKHARTNLLVTGVGSKRQKKPVRKCNYFSWSSHWHLGVK